MQDNKLVNKNKFKCFHVVDNGERNPKKKLTNLRD